MSTTEQTQQEFPRERGRPTPSTPASPSRCRTPSRPSPARCRFRGFARGRQADRRRADQQLAGQGGEPRGAPPVAGVLRRRAPSRGDVHLDEIRRDGDTVEIDGEITIKGITRPAILTGTATGPAVDHFGATRLGPHLTTTVDRTAFDINWNMPLPNGEPASSNDVTLKADLTLVAQTSRPRRRCASSRSAAPFAPTPPTRPSSALCARRRRRGSRSNSGTGSRRFPPTTATTTSCPARAGRGAPRVGTRRRCRLLRDARVQLVRPGRAQERARLGVEAARDERVPQQARRRDQRERRCVRRGLGGSRAPQGARRDGRTRHRRRGRRSGTRPRSSRTGQLVDHEVRQELRDALNTLVAEVPSALAA